MKYFRIEAPHFVAGCAYGVCAPIIKYMQHWPIERVRSYCKIKGWLLTENPVREQISSKSSLGIIRSADMNGYGNDYSNIFGSIARSKPMGTGYVQRLGLGSHRVALRSYKVKDSTKGQGQFIEAEFVVVKSTSHEPGEIRGWVWFINASGQWAAAYEQDRAKKFLEAVGSCVGDDSPIDVIGGNLAGPEQAGKGLLLEVDIVPQGGKNAGKTNSRGEPYTNAYWKPIQQSLDDLAASREEIEQLEASAPAPQPTQQTQPAPRQGLGMLGGGNRGR